MRIILILIWFSGVFPYTRIMVFETKILTFNYFPYVLLWYWIYVRISQNRHSCSHFRSSCLWSDKGWYDECLSWGYAWEMDGTFLLPSGLHVRLSDRTQGYGRSKIKIRWTRSHSTRSFYGYRIFSSCMGEAWRTHEELSIPDACRP